MVKHTGTAKKVRSFNSGTFLSTIGDGRHMLFFPKNATIFAQNDPSDGLFFIQRGKIVLRVESENGKEATLGILGEEDFFGEGGLAGQLVRMSSVTAMTDCVVLHIEKEAMRLALSQEPALSASFIEYLLKRNTRYQQDLVDQLCSSSEMRLARILLRMAHFDQEEVVSYVSVPRPSQKTLSEMVGTTRSRVSFFMSRFRKLGFITYGKGHNLRIRSSLLRVVLDGDCGTATPGDAQRTTRGEKARQTPAQAAQLCRS
jgi:CRP/FNR family cyclic AMP-dependent transcriptional regulator